MSARPTPQELVEHALHASRSDGCVVIVRAASSANLRWAGNTMTTNGVTEGLGVTVIAFRSTDGGTAAGAVSGSATDVDRVSALVAQADAAASVSEPAPDAAELVAGGEAPDWGLPPGRTSIEVYAEVAPGLGRAFRTASSDQRLLYGFVDHDVTTTYLGTSTGLRLRHEQPTGHWGVTGKPADLSASAWVGGATRDFTDVRVDEVVEELDTRLGWARRHVDLPAGRYDTVLPPTAVADLLVYVYWVAGARAAHDGRSVFSRPGGGTRVGDRLSRRPVRLSSDPAHPWLQAAPFVVASASGDQTSVFDNGLPLTRTDWVRDGTLAALVQTRETAALTGQAVTPAVDNLVLEVDGAAGGVSDLVAGTERGLLVTCLWYIREVDPQTLLLTGLTRDGVYLVEDGAVTGAVNNFRFNESPVHLLDRFTDATATVPAFSREWGDYFPRTAMPALRVPDFHMSTVSPAQ